MVNLAAFFELFDALILLWVQSSQGVVSDGSVNEVRKIIPVFILIGNIYLHTKILKGETNFNVIICPIVDKFS